MNFTLSTKPLANALDLGVINNNVSKFYQKSCLAQITADSRTLRINLEAAFIASEIILSGSGDSSEPVTAFVDCLLLKQLVHTLESSTVTLEYIEGGVVIKSGSSKFTLPKMIEEGDLDLTRPRPVGPESTTVKINNSDWKFVKDHQMYAIAMSFTTPVYTRVWVGQDGDVITGDFNGALFTFSNKSKLGATCLLSDTIINLFNSLPEGAELSTLDKSYRLSVKTDGFEYAAEFTPQYEEDEGVGSYNADMIKETAAKDEANKFTVEVAPISKALSQSELLSTNADANIDISLSSGELRISDDNVDCKIKVGGDCGDFKMTVKSAKFKSILSNLDTPTMTACPLWDGDECAGIVVWTDNLTVLLGSQEDDV